MQVMLIDASNFCYRAFYSHRLLATKDGKNTGLIYGALEALLFLRHKYPDWALVFCWDGGGKTWRHVLMDDFYGLDHKKKPKATPMLLDTKPGQVLGYKANRADAHASEERQHIYCQIPYFRELVLALGLHQLFFPHMEADDVIGIMSHRLVEAGHTVMVHSSDQDFNQLLSDKVSIMKKASEGITITADYFENAYGIVPKQWTKIRALCGDSSDNLPGLPRVGEKTAIKHFLAGLDVGYAVFDGLPEKVAQSYKQFAPYWPQARLVYQMSIICRRFDSRFPHSLQERFEATSKILLAHPRRQGRTQEDYTMFLQYLTQWELASIIDRRTDFWKFV